MPWQGVHIPSATPAVPTLLDPEPISRVKHLECSVPAFQLFLILHEILKEVEKQSYFLRNHVLTLVLVMKNWNKICWRRKYPPVYGGREDTGNCGFLELIMFLTTYPVVLLIVFDGHLACQGGRGELDTPSGWVCRAFSYAGETLSVSRKCPLNFA